MTQNSHPNLLASVQFPLILEPQLADSSVGQPVAAGVAKWQTHRT